MTTPILAIKLSIPPSRPKIVLRSRLIERLNEGLRQNHGFGRKLTLISAPAGFGKTTLVREWVAGWQEDEPGVGVAWLSLDEGDNDTTRFLICLVAALQTVFPQMGSGVLDLLQSPHPPPPKSILTDLLNEITAASANIILVLDDYHIIDSKVGEASRSIDGALSFLLEHLPPQMHLVIATREDPNLPLARLRSRDQLVELRVADLRFTPPEAAEFIAQVMGLNISTADADALEVRTEGWVAGLQLAALALREHPDVSSFIQSFTGSHHFVLDYLLEEVLNQQPESIQTFLLRTSILERMSGPLCDAVCCYETTGSAETGARDPNSNGQQTDGQKILEYLEHANLFIVPLDNERHWYRYHHLFADLLRQRLQQSAASPTGKGGKYVADLHSCASVWYQDNGMEREAFQHAVAAKDFDRAAGLAELAWPAMDGRFQTGAWLGWVKALPDEVVRARPVLNVDYAWALLNNRELEAGESRLLEVERWLGTLPVDIDQQQARPADLIIVDERQLKTLPGSIATARAYIAQTRGDVPGTIKYTRQALDLLPEGDHHKRGPAAALLGLAYWTNGDLEAAHRALADAMANFQRVGSIHFAISGTYGLADIRITQGRIREAIRTYEYALQVAAEQDVPVIRGTANLHLGLSELHRERGDLESARQHMLKSEELGEQAALAPWTHRICRARARFKEDQGDLEGALEMLDEAERKMMKSPVPEVRPIAALKARVWIAQGRLAEARGWAKEQGLSADDTLSYLREFEHITLARVLIAEYKNDHSEGSILVAKELLERLLRAAQEGGRTGSVIEIVVLQALANQAQGCTRAALTALEQALILAHPEGYIRIFVDEGLSMAHMLKELNQRGTEPNYVQRLLKSFTYSNTEQPLSLHKQNTQLELAEPLSQREIEVLRLITQGLSNREISDRLFIALNTVKGYNQKIFSKLQVQSRTEAIVRVRELDLL